MARVLVIDDEYVVRDMLAEILEAHGHDVVQARDGVEGLREARGRRPDLIVLDLMMPSMSGWEFRRAQAQDPALARIPVIVVSAVSPGPGERADARFEKPFDLGRFLAAVDRLTGGVPAFLAGG